MIPEHGLDFNLLSKRVGVCACSVVCIVHLGHSRPHKPTHPPQLLGMRGRVLDPGTMNITTDPRTMNITTDPVL